MAPFQRALQRARTLSRPDRNNGQACPLLFEEALSPFGIKPSYRLTRLSQRPRGWPDRCSATDTGDQRYPTRSGNRSGRSDSALAAQARRLLTYPSAIYEAGLAIGHDLERPGRGR